MVDSKLVKLLRGLSAEDFRHIRKMLRSPFFTSNVHLLALFDLLKTAHPDFLPKKIDKQKIFKKIFPKHRYSDIKLRNLSSDLVRLIEDYLIYQKIKSNPFERRKQLAGIYKEKAYPDLFQRTLKQLKLMQAASNYKDHLFFKERLDLKLLELEYQEHKNLNRRYQLLVETIQTLDRYNELSKARYELTMKNLQSIIKTSDLSIDASEEKEPILIQIYQQFGQLYEENDPRLFEHLRGEFEKNIQKIRPALQKELLSLLINFGIKSMNLDDEKYNKVVLNLYKLGLQHKMIFTVDRNSDNAYFNIVVSGAKAKDFEWTRMFIEEKEKHLSLKTKEDIKTISLSIYHFHKMEFSQAVDLIAQHHFKQAQIKTIARTHAIRCYYELYLQDSTYYDLLIAQIESDIRFSRRNKMLTAEKLRSNLNFLNFIKRLANQRLGGKLKKEGQAKMLLELSELKITLSRSWLIELIKR